MKTTIIAFKNWAYDENEIKESYDVWKNHEGKIIYINDDLTEISNMYHAKTNYIEAKITKCFKKSIHVVISKKSQEEIEKEIYSTNDIS